ncbi:MAG: 50S ribosomal protein L33 [Bacilli bacterium]|nr:50S ribosomal protein L33 [Bacilli bacterium]
MRKKIILVCSECLSRNYVTTKDPYASKDRFEVTKFCKKCNKHTIHRESK